ncbi:MAG TPA: HD domain-containing phosphohydrolase, partial [Pyrinomonadaceae bacterium]
RHGEQILCGIEFLEGAARVVAQHHERWDGTGYPVGLRGEEIDLNARIFAVADAFDAITSNRVYRTGKSYEAAIAELDAHAGRQFDPQIVATFRSIPYAEWERLRARSLARAAEDEESGRSNLKDDAGAATAPLASAVNKLSALAAVSNLLLPL